MKTHNPAVNTAGPRKIAAHFRLVEGMHAFLQRRKPKIDS